MRYNGGQVANWSTRNGVRGTIPPKVAMLFKEFDVAREVLVQSRPDILKEAVATKCPRPELTTFSYLLCEQDWEISEWWADTQGN